VSAIGKRLAEERKRLGYSQSAFADLVGVSFSSQRRYEDGRSSPDTAYLEAAAKAGVDVGYVLGPTRWTPEHKLERMLLEYKVGPTGEVFSDFNGNEHQVFFDGGRDLVALILGALGVSDSDWNRITERLIVINESGLPAVIGDDPAWGAEIAKASPLIRKLVEEAGNLDSALLARVVEGVVSTATQTGCELAPDKKAKAIAMLYRAFKASGKVDPAMIEEAVKLAAD